MIITATCSNPRPSLLIHLVVLLDVEVTLEDGILLQHGSLAFVRAFDGKMTPYGDGPDSWIDWRLLKSLRILAAPGSRYELDFDAALAELQRAALAVIR